MRYGVNVRLWLSADTLVGEHRVRFDPESGHHYPAPQCLLCAQKRRSLTALPMSAFLSKADNRASWANAVYAVTSSAAPSSFIIASRILNFCALPVTVIGISATKRI
jgi:hypothetical protein